MVSRRVFLKSGSFALVSLLASLAIPNLVASRMAANETAAVSTLRKINEAQTLFKLVDTLEDDDDVQTVWGNYEVSDAVMEKLG